MGTLAFVALPSILLLLGRPKQTEYGLIRFLSICLVERGIDRIASVACVSFAGSFSCSHAVLDLALMVLIYILLFL